MSSAQSQRIESCYRNLVPSLIFGKMDVNFFFDTSGSSCLVSQYSEFQSFKHCAEIEVFYFHMY